MIKINEIVTKLESIKELIGGGEPTENVIEEIDFLLSDIQDDHAQDSGYLSDDHLDTFEFEGGY
jgi:uncharacterized protein YbbC (DUF1343 family)|tara:strand:- start:6975 stop:7166 length:192 start_codon:yes stop_codon:yes gene_type:complete